MSQPQVHSQEAPQPKPAVKENTIITKIYDAEKDEIIPYDFVNNMIFSDPVAEPVPQPADSKDPPMFGHRIKIKTRNPDGSIGDLVFETEVSFTFGVQENKDRQTQAVTGYSVSVCIWHKDGPTKPQLYLTQLSDQILDHMKNHLIKQEVRTKIADPQLEKSDLKKMKLFYWKIDKLTGLRIPGRGPTAYPKLITSKKSGGLKILSRFFLMDSINEEGIPIELDPMKLIGQRGTLIARFKIDSIYKGAQISPQLKLWEADFKPLETGFKRMGEVKQDCVVYSNNTPMPSSVLNLLYQKKQAENKNTTATGASSDEGRPDAAAVITFDNPGAGNPLAVGVAGAVNSAVSAASSLSMAGLAPTAAMAVGQR
jgi:hypothetical protein